MIPLPSSFTKRGPNTFYMSRLHVCVNVNWLKLLVRSCFMCRRWAHIKEEWSRLHLKAYVEVYGIGIRAFFDTFIRVHTRTDNRPHSQNISETIDGVWYDKSFHEQISSTRHRDTSACSLVRCILRYSFLHTFEPMTSSYRRWFLIRVFYHKVSPCLQPTQRCLNH